MKIKDRYLGLAQTLLLNVCDAPKAHFGQLVPPVLIRGPRQPEIGLAEN